MLEFVSDPKMNATELNREAAGAGRCIAVTGAGGFLGSHVCGQLAARGHDVRALVRDEAAHLTVPQIRYDGLHDTAVLRAALNGATVVVHLAARVHVMQERSADPLKEFRRANVDTTRALAELAVREGVEEFYFTSSVKAVGEENTYPWSESHPPFPADPYGKSKLEAEYALAEISARSGMTTVAIRLPLVYGPGVRANMLRMFQLIDHGWPLPLGGLDNRRSLIFAGNVGAAVALLLGRVEGHEVFFASDGQDVSTSELVRAIGRVLGRKPRLFPVPDPAVRLLRRFGPRRIEPVATRLFGSLTVDTTKLRTRIGGPLPYTFDEGLVETARWFRTKVQK